MRSFDLIAKPYRWMEYLTFGRLLERCRFFRLPSLTAARRALVLGDGDGRFVARLLAANREVRVDAVDLSPAMLALLKERAHRLGQQAECRLTIHCVDVRSFEPPTAGYDLVVTHFFLDCLTTEEVQDLAKRLYARLSPGARWIVSDFGQGEQGIATVFSRIVVGLLYLAFRVLTRLQVRTLPDHATALEEAGFQRQSCQTWLRGLLISEEWQRSNPIELSFRANPERSRREVKEPAVCCDH
jgi:cyclopropane fatty-acyl-phospholipid synthase-like methyltransferase